MMMNHSCHDVIALKRGFVYCRDPSTVVNVEMLCEQMKDMSIEPDVSTGSRSQQPEVESNEKTGNKTEPEEKFLTPVVEIVYDRERDQKKYFEAKSQPMGVSLDKGTFWHKY